MSLDQEDSGSESEEEYKVERLVEYDYDEDDLEWYKVLWAPQANGEPWPDGDTSWQLAANLKRDLQQDLIDEFWADMRKEGKTYEGEKARLIKINASHTRSKKTSSKRRRGNKSSANGGPAKKAKAAVVATPPPAKPVPKAAPAKAQSSKKPPVVESSAAKATRSRVTLAATIADRSSRPSSANSERGSPAASVVASKRGHELLEEMKEQVKRSKPESGTFRDYRYKKRLEAAKLGASSSRELDQQSPLKEAGGSSVESTPTKSSSGQSESFPSPSDQSPSSVSSSKNILASCSTSKPAANADASQKKSRDIPIITDAISSKPANRAVENAQPRDASFDEIAHENAESRDENLGSRDDDLAMDAASDDGSAEPPSLSLADSIASESPPCLAAETETAAADVAHSSLVERQSVDSGNDTAKSAEDARTGRGSPPNLDDMKDAQFSDAGLPLLQPCNVGEAATSSASMNLDELVDSLASGMRKVVLSELQKAQLLQEFTDLRRDIHAEVERSIQMERDLAMKRLPKDFAFPVEDLAELMLCEAEPDSHEFTRGIYTDMVVNHLAGTRVLSKSGLLRAAVHAGMPDVVEQLLNQPDDAAGVSTPPLDLNQPDECGVTLLMVCAMKLCSDLNEHSYHKIADLLLTNGAIGSSATRHTNSTALMAVANTGAGCMLNVLLKHGVNLGAKRTLVVEQGCETALMLAIQNENANVVEAMLLAGANPSQENARGENALAIARNFADDRMIAIINGFYANCSAVDVVDVARRPPRGGNWTSVHLPPDTNATFDLDENAVGEASIDRLVVTCSDLTTPDGSAFPVESVTLNGRPMPSMAKNKSFSVCAIDGLSETGELNVVQIKLKQSALGQRRNRILAHPFIFAPISK